MGERVQREVGALHHSHPDGVGLGNNHRRYRRRMARGGPPLGYGVSGHRLPRALEGPGKRKDGLTPSFGFPPLFHNLSLCESRRVLTRARDHTMQFLETDALYHLAPSVVRPFGPSRDLLRDSILLPVLAIPTLRARVERDVHRRASRLDVCPSPASASARRNRAGWPPRSRKLIELSLGDHRAEGQYQLPLVLARHDVRRKVSARLGR